MFKTKTTHTKQNKSSLKGQSWISYTTPATLLHTRHVSVKHSRFSEGTMKAASQTRTHTGAAHTPPPSLPEAPLSLALPRITVRSVWTGLHCSPGCNLLGLSLKLKRKHENNTKQNKNNTVDRQRWGNDNNLGPRQRFSVPEKTPRMLLLLLSNPPRRSGRQHRASLLFASVLLCVVSVGAALPGK